MGAPMLPHRRPQSKIVSSSFRANETSDTKNQCRAKEAKDAKTLKDKFWSAQSRLAFASLAIFARDCERDFG